MSTYSMPSSRRLRSGFRIGLFDFCCAAVAPLVALSLRDVNLFVREEASYIILYVVLTFVVTITMLVRFRVGSGLPKFFAVQDILQIAKASFGAVTVTTILLFSVTRLDHVPRSLPAIHFLVLFAMLLGGRFLLKTRTRSKAGTSAALSYVPENIIVVGANELTSIYLRMLESLRAPLTCVVGIVDENKSLQGRSIGGHAVIGAPRALPSLLDEYTGHGVDIHRIVVAAEYAEPATALWDALKGICDERGIALEYLPQRLGLLTTQAHRAISLPELAEDAHKVIGAERQQGYWRSKRGVDLVVSGVLLVLLSPLMLAGALLTALNGGFPIVFWQRRLGRHGNPICVYKFRTFCSPFDPHGRRLTPVERLSRLGRFMRASKLDELPQLYNVFVGDMSIVGPRPLLSIDQPAGPSRRLAVLPGLTGWAQVNGGSLISPEEKNALDEWYIDNASVRLDLYILLLTIRAIIFGDCRDEAGYRHSFGLRRSGCVAGAKIGASDHGKLAEIRPD